MLHTPSCFTDKGIQLMVSDCPKWFRLLSELNPGSPDSVMGVASIATKCSVLCIYSDPCEPLSILWSLWVPSHLSL